MGDRRPLPYGRQTIEEDDIAAVVEALRGDWLTQGPAIARFEEALAAQCGARHAVAVSSGTAALHLACLAAGVRPGRGGVTSDVTFVASANAIRYAGGAPRLADVDPRTALVRPDAMELAARTLAASGVTPRVLVPVDFAGTVADLPAVRAVADRLGALVIEDAAHSLGATYDHDGSVYRAGCGAHAHAAILSFHPVKHVTTCEGGAIVTNDSGMYRELLDLRTHGITKDPARLSRNDGPWYYEQQSLGYHYRITDVQCALGLSQLAKLARFVERRRHIAATYDRLLAPLAHLVRPLEVPAGRASSYHLYVVQLVQRPGESLADLAGRRRALFVALRDAAIQPQIHYIPVHRQPDFVANGLSEGQHDGAERYYASCISLPMYPTLEDRDVARVVDSIAQRLDAGEP